MRRGHDHPLNGGAGGRESVGMRQKRHEFFPAA